MNNLPQVVCAGVVVADHLSSPIDHAPAAGELVTADELVLNIGGCACNASMALARFGVESIVCGKVGNDVFGRFVIQTLETGGVNASCLAVDPKQPTSQTLIVNVKGQDRRFVHSFGANGSLRVADFLSAIEPTPAVFYLGGYLILPGIDPRALGDFFKLLRTRGCRVLLDVATPGPGDYLPMLEPVLPHVDVFLPNADESRLILGEGEPRDYALAFRKLGADHVVITCGEKGAIAAWGSKTLRVGAYPVSFVDGTGGGDAFDAGYIAGLLEGSDEIGCLKLASALGASCVRAVGTTAGVFNRAQAEAFIAEHDLEIREA